MNQPIADVVERIRREPSVPLRVEGRVETLVGHAIEVVGVPAQLGSVLRVDRTPQSPALAEIVGFNGDRAIAMPLNTSEGIARGATAMLLRDAERGGPDAEACLGRVIDGLAKPLDDGPPVPRRFREATASAFSPSLQRARIDRPVDVGLRAINALHTIGRGSRIGLFAGAGVGKSTLLGQIARFTESDVVVVGLIGERGREVREFVEREVGEALARSIVVVATCDEPAVMRRRAAILAAELAHDLAEQGRNVLLLMDSLTRFCMAQREIGLSAGEPPATRGYPPSVWSVLPQLLERAGTTPGSGSVTGIYTVLVEGDDMEEPVADAAKSLLDGHILLSRTLAERGAFPAIDPLSSISRVMPDVVPTEHLRLATAARAHLSLLAESEDLIRIGAYSPGTDPSLDAAVRLAPALRAFLMQSRDEHASMESTTEGLRTLLQGTNE